MNLTKEEEKYILSDLYDGLDSCRYTSSGKINLRNFEKAKFEDYDLSDKKEFDICKSIILKLKRSLETRKC